MRISGEVARRLRGAAEEYGLEPEGLVDYLLTVLVAAPQAAPKKEEAQEDYSEVLERLKNLGYT